VQHYIDAYDVAVQDEIVRSARYHVSPDETRYVPGSNL